MIPGVPVQFDGVSEEVIAELRRGQFAKDWFAARTAPQRQRTIAGEAQGRRAVPGLGQPQMALDPFVYHAWARQLGGYGCWHEDGDLSRYLRRHFDETRVRAEKNMSTVGWTPAGTVRFRKHYGA